MSWISLNSGKLYLFLLWIFKLYTVTSQNMRKTASLNDLKGHTLYILQSQIKHIIERNASLNDIDNEFNFIYNETEDQVSHLRCCCKRE